MREATWLKSSLILCLLLSTTIAEERLDIHIIPHSHCDPGWLKSFDGYYQESVKHILNNVLDTLSRDSSRTFNWAEISFFNMWWQEQSEERRSQWKRMVQSKQIEFIGGGYVQNDEAGSSLDIVINQVSDGHEWIQKNFGTRPRIAWQIDPFGHSSLTPSLFSQMGYEAMVINRIHHRLKGDYKSKKQMEFIWKASPSLGEEHSMFTHVLHTHYSAPDGFDWENYGWEMPRQKISDSNVEYKARDLINMLRGRSQSYKTKHLLVAWGDDFKFANAQEQFSNMDQILKYINANADKLNADIKYSTLSRYFDAVKETTEKEKIKFPLYSETDFFPYADNDDSYWTGYYTSRAHSKSYHRRSIALIRNAETFYTMARSEIDKLSDKPQIDVQELQNDLVTANYDLDLFAHHDGITGTARSDVVRDYLERMGRSQEKSKKVLKQSVETLLTHQGQRPPLRDNPELYEFSSAGEKCKPIVLTNSLGWNRINTVCVVSDGQSLSVWNDNTEVPSQISPVYLKDGDNVKEMPELNRNEICFEGDVSGLGIKTYFLCNNVKSEMSDVATVEIFDKAKQPGSKNKMMDDKAEMKIDNEYFTVTFGDKGFISGIVDKKSKKTYKVTTSYSEYQTNRGGAYIFIPSGDAQDVWNDMNQLHIFKGPIMEEAILYFGRHNTIRVSLYNHRGTINERFISVKQNVKSSQPNRELVVRYSTELKTGTTFFTDNGIEMLARTGTGATQTRYYPMQSTAFMQDSSTAVQFTVLSRTVSGCTMNKEGSLEVMLHRSCHQDDGRGLSERMEDGAPVQNDHILLLEDLSLTEMRRQQMQLNHEHPLQILTSDPTEKESFLSKYRTEYHPLVEEGFPNNVHVYSLKYRDATSREIVLRLGHIYESSNANELAKSVNVDIQGLFREDSWTIDGITQKGLSLNEKVEKYVWPVDGTEKVSPLTDAILSAKRIKSGKQNSDEEGVFLSQDALELARKKKEQQEKLKHQQEANQTPAAAEEGATPREGNGRILLSVSDDVIIHPVEINTYLTALTPSAAFKQELVEKFSSSSTPVRPNRPVVKPQAGEPRKQQAQDRDRPRVDGKRANNVNDRGRLSGESGVSGNEVSTLFILTVVGVGLVLFSFLQLQRRRLRSYLVNAER